MHCKTIAHIVRVSFIRVVCMCVYVTHSLAHLLFDFFSFYVASSFFLRYFMLIWLIFFLAYTIVCVWRVWYFWVFWCRCFCYFWIFNVVVWANTVFSTPCFSPFWMYLVTRAHINGMRNIKPATYYAHRVDVCICKPFALPIPFKNFIFQSPFYLARRLTSRLKYILNLIRINPNLKLLFR